MPTTHRPPLALAAALVLAAVPAAAFDHDHAALTAVLAAHVRDGSVDYTALRRAPGPLHAYLAALEAVTPDEHRRFSRDEKLAFWINAYNAYTLKLVLDHEPVPSIKKIGRFWESPFAIEFIPLGRLRSAAGPISLDTIEHEVLRGELAEPLVHGAIVCASKSCPRLRSDAFRAEGIGEALGAAMRDFLADPRRNRWDRERRRLMLSSIFKWFREDFEGARGSLLAFVLAYLPPEAAKEVRAGDEPAIEFLDYDWSLNGS